MSLPSARNWQRAETYFHSGNLDAARAVCESLLVAFPSHAPAHWMLSRIQQSQRHFRQAVHHARLAARDIGNLPLGQMLIVTRALISTGEYQMALQALHGIDVSDSIDTPTLTQIPDQLTALDDHGNARVWLDYAAKQGARSSEIAFLRGNNLKFVGEIANAAGAYEDAIALMPGNPHPHLARATLGLADGAGARIDRIRRVLSGLQHAQAGMANDATVLQYALFRELDTLGDTDAAWDALTSAMRYKRMVIRHDPRAEDALFDRLLATYTEDYLSGGEQQDLTRTPVFIVGMPRSGTTLLERVIGGHPELVACGELSELRMAFKWASDYYCNAFLDVEAATRIAGIDARALGKDYLKRMAWRTTGHRWFIDKHPGNVVFCGLILRAIPHARIINIRRNPMDSCFSNMRELFAPHYYEYSYEIEDVANHYKNYTRLMEHFPGVAPGRILDVRYENFVRDPERETARILDFCGIAHQAGLTDVTSNRNAVSTASSVQVRDPIHANRIDYWKRYEKHLQPLTRRLEALSIAG